MPFITKYLQGFIRFHLDHLIAGSKSESTQIDKLYSLKTVILKNKELAAELEKACKKNNGLLTFSEYLTIDQFGKNGYHAKNKYHGEQKKCKDWGQSLAKYCLDNKISNIIDFGPGNGDLGIYTLKYGKSLTWNGIEINKDLRTVIRNNFQKENLTSQLKFLTPTLEEMKIDQKSTIVFSFSLDNLAPEMLINTSKSLSFPTAIIGITVSKNILQEVILTDSQLQKKGLKLKNGLFTDNKKQIFDLTAWKLSHLQRACIPLPAATTLTSFAKKVKKDSLILIIDEFSPNPYYAHTEHLNLPKDLMAYYRYFDNLNYLYENSGNGLLYFPTYPNAYMKTLKSLGYAKIKVGFENEMANKLAKKEILKPVKSFCLAMTGIKKQPIKFPVVLGAYSPISSID